VGTTEHWEYRIGYAEDGKDPITNVFWCDAETEEEALARAAYLNKLPGVTFLQIQRRRLEGVNHDWLAY
jgi:hypothetical protein